MMSDPACRVHVASREGGVDRNKRRWTCRAYRAGRLPRGGRGSQLTDELRQGAITRRLPRGGRGSQPGARSAWSPSRPASPPARGAWIATPCGRGRGSRPGSPPARGAWIATPSIRCRTALTVVASREGGVDRNDQTDHIMASGMSSPPARGAWIATRSAPGPCSSPWSPPARGAWIATTSRGRCCADTAVASREGGVDRNPLNVTSGLRPESRLPRGGRGSQPVLRHHPPPAPPSPPARGAWIATVPRRTWSRCGLSPPARGAWIATHAIARARQTRTRRLPRGGRGSQLLNLLLESKLVMVASREGGVDRNEAFRKLGPAEKEVASREGGVDRNSVQAGGSGSAASPPARGAWIAILRSREKHHPNLSPKARRIGSEGGTRAAAALAGQSASGMPVELESRAQSQVESHASSLLTTRVTIRMSPNGGGRHMAGMVLRDALRRVGVPGGDYARASPSERGAAARLMRRWDVGPPARVQAVADALEAGKLADVARYADPNAQPLHGLSPGEPIHVELVPIDAPTGRVEVRATLSPFLVRDALARADGTAVAVAVSHALVRGAVLADPVFAGALEPVLRAFDQALGLRRAYAPAESERPQAAE